MRDHLSRRRFFLSVAAGGAALAAAGRAAGRATPIVEDPSGEAPSAAASPPAVGSPTAFELDPLVRTLEDLPRERLLEDLAGQIRRGLAYPRLLGALTVAGVRNVQPRPHVGFKFHAVLGIHSCHLAARSASDEERWLPLLWAADYFKSSQAEERRASGWTQRPVDEGAVPRARAAEAELVQALDRWEEGPADAAATAVARHVGSGRAFDLFARYGARDWRSIGHKAIFVANGFRTLDEVGWRHAEPILRSMAHALLNREGSDPLDGTSPADRAWSENRERAGELGESWLEGRVEPDRVPDLLEALREASDLEASGLVAKRLRDGLSPRTLWDALLLAAAEIFVRQPSIVSLHAVTTANAIHYGFQRAGDPLTRKLLLLQAAAFLPLFRERAGGGREIRIDRLEPLPPDAKVEEAAEEVLSSLDGDRELAARKLLGYLDAGGDPRVWIARAAGAVTRRVRESHDFKFASAILEDFHNVSPAWRNRLLAASVYRIPGPGVPENASVREARELLGRPKGN